MSNTLISKDLLKKTLDHYYTFKDLMPDRIIQRSIPILFFGDLKNYLKNDFKIITAALNPSDMEFKIKGDKRYSTKIRFEDFDGSIESLETAYCNYFKKKPYEWFGKNMNKHLDKGFKPILNGMGYCYYPNKKNLNPVLHTDLCSPLATNPTWNGLTNKEKNKLITEGFPIWINLMKEIKPDLIVASLAFKEIERLNPHLIETIFKKNDSYKINLYDINLDGFKTKLLWGNAQNTPFMPFKNKYDIGQSIIKKLNNYF